MPLILYLPKKAKAAEHLLQSISAAIPEGLIERVTTPGELSERLQQPMPDVRVAVLYAADHAELLEITYLNWLLGDLKVVLVLPDGDPEMLEKAYVLCPRFIAAAESDFRHLGAVLKKMMETHAASR